MEQASNIERAYSDINKAVFLILSEFKLVLQIEKNVNFIYIFEKLKYMNIYSFPDIVAIIFNGSLAVRMLTQKGSGRINYWVASFLLLFTLWNITNLVSLNVTDRDWVLFVAQITYRILFLFPAVIIAFAFNFERKLRNRQLYLRNLIIFVVPVLLLLFGFPRFNFQLREIDKPQLMYYYTFVYKPDFAFIGLILVSAVYLILTFFIVRKKNRYISGIQRKKMFATLTYGIMILYLLFFMIFIPFLQNPSYSFIYLLRTSFLFLEVFFFYHVVRELEKEYRQHLPDNFVSYLSLTVFVAIYFILLKEIVVLVDDYFGIHNFYFNATLIFSLTLVFKPAESLIHQFVFHNVKNQIYRYRTNLLKLTNELMVMYPDRQFLEKIRRFILDNFRSEEVYLYRYNEDIEMFTEFRIIEEIPASSELIVRLREHKDNIAEFTDLEKNRNENRVYDYFRQKNIRLFVPIKKDSELIMFFALAQKKDHKDYSLDELDVLAIFANEIALYLQRNFLYEKNQLAEREKIRLEKLAALGQLTAGIAHEIRNPLNTISAATQTLVNESVSEEVRKRMARYIDEEIHRLSNLITEFLEFSRLRKPEYVEVDIRKLLSKLSLFLQSKNDKISYVIENKITKPVWTDAGFLYQILSNLGLNALEALEGYCEAGTLTCDEARMKVTCDMKNDKMILTVENNGGEIPSGNAENIFEPFYTTKEQGTGLGLSLVENMVKGLGGKITLKTLRNKTVFVILIPLKHES